MSRKLATKTFFYVIAATGGLKRKGKKRIPPYLEVIGPAHASRKAAAAAADKMAETDTLESRFYVTEAVSGFKRSNLVSYKRFDA